MEWLQNKVFPSAVWNGGFGTNMKFINFVPDSKKGQQQFSSDVIFGTVILENSSKQLIEEHVVVKVQPKGGLVSKMCDLNALFHNELLFYTEIVPLYKRHDAEGIFSKMVPEFVYGRASYGEKPEEDVIILKNLSTKGFKLTDSRIFMDREHITLALEKIGHFHALSYKCQEEEPATFYRIVSRLKNCYIEHESVKADKVADCAYRGIDPLKNDPEYKDRLDAIYSHAESALDYVRRAKRSRKPLPVICHGDFQRNNMMFKYDRQGKPQDVVFFDFAAIGYCSPTIDLSIILMVNTSPKVKRIYWDEFLETYHDSLSAVAAEYFGSPSFDAILFGVRKHGVHAYYLCAMFLPVLVNNTAREDFDSAADAKEPLDAIASWNDEQTTDLLSEMVRHMIDQHFLFEQLECL